MSMAAYPSPRQGQLRSSSGRDTHVIDAIEEIIAELSQPKNRSANPENDTQFNQSNFGRVDPENTQSNFGAANVEQSNADFAARNFLLSEYTDTSGKKNKQYILTRDGFTLLAMGFTGAKAMQFKVAYISAFNRMEQLIRGTGAGMLETAVQTSAQLETVNSIATEGKNDAAETVAEQTLQALSAALESGIVSIRRKYKQDPTPENCIGVYDSTAVTVYNQELYKLYSESTAQPLPYTAWHCLLKDSKAVEFLKATPSYKDKSKHKSRTIIARSNLKFDPEKGG